MSDVIIKPIITESSMKLVPDGKYSFVVATRADKTAIKKAISKQFNVTVVSIATNVVKGKTKRVGPKRVEITKTAWKKAIVTLKKGEKIYMFEPGGEEPTKDAKKDTK
jgi:large subunit ribosomal protein L23